jgi:hypothetical protein
MAWYSLKVFPIRYDWLKLFLLFLAGIVLGWFQFFVGPEQFKAGVVLGIKASLLVLYLAFAMLLFRVEAQLLAVKVGNKFRRN